MSVKNRSLAFNFPETEESAEFVVAFVMFRFCSGI